MPLLISMGCVGSGAGTETRIVANYLPCASVLPGVAISLTESS